MLQQLLLVTRWQRSSLSLYACIYVCVCVCMSGRYQMGHLRRKLPACYARSPTLSTLTLSHTHRHSVSLPCFGLSVMLWLCLLLSRSVALFQAAAARCYSPSAATPAATAAARHLLVGRAHNSFCGFIVCLCPFVLPCKCADKNKICKTLNESRYRHTHAHTHVSSCVCLRTLLLLLLLL